MRLYIVRHAAAVDRGDFNYPDDADRPLTEDGRKRFRRLVEKLSQRGVAPKVIATSPFVRAKQTAEILAKHVVGGAEIVEVDGLKPESNLDELIRWCERRKETEIAWIGHMPDVSDLTATLIGHSARIGFSKGATAAIDFEDHPSEGRGILCWLATPKLLGC